MQSVKRKSRKMIPTTRSSDIIVRKLKAENSDMAKMLDKVHDKACEQSLETRCRCDCGGRYHGIHPSSVHNHSLDEFMFPENSDDKEVT